MKRVEKTSLSLAPVFLGQCIVFSMDVNNIVLMKMLKTMLLHLAAHLQCIITEKKSFRFKLVYTSDGCHPILLSSSSSHLYVGIECLYVNLLYTPEQRLRQLCKNCAKTYTSQCASVTAGNTPTHQSTQL